MNADTKSTPAPPTKWPQETLSPTPTSSLLVNKSSLLKSSTPTTFSMPPTPHQLPPTTPLLLTNKKTGTSPVNSLTRDTKSTNHATKLRTTSPSMVLDQLTTPTWMLTGTSMSATANQSMAERPVNLMIPSVSTPAVRRNNPSLTPMRISTRESTLKLRRPSVTSSVRPSTDASPHHSTAALTSKTEILHQ